MATRLLLVILFAALVVGTGVAAGPARDMASTNNQVTTPAGPEQNLRQLFERARLLDEKNQDLPQAIQLYEQVVSKAKEQRALAAKAQLQIGLLYERLGRRAEAERAFRAVLGDFPDQADIVRQARQKVPGSRPSAERGAGVTFRQIKFDGLEKSWFARLSPDGKKMLYICQAPKMQRNDVCVRDIASNQEQVLAEDVRLNDLFVWSPDGGKAAYSRQQRELRSIRTGGGDSQLLWSSGNGELTATPLDWSRDGRYLLLGVTSRADSTDRLAILPASGGEPRYLVSGRLGELGLRAQFSPDARYVAGERTSANNTDIFVWTVEGGQQTRVTEDPAKDSQPGWSPDGSYLVFLSDRMKTNDLWAVRMKGPAPAGEPVMVKRNVGRGVLLTDFSAGGQVTMAIADEGAAADLFAVPAGALGQPRPQLVPFAKYPTVHFHARWSADGKRVAYTSRKGQFEFPKIFVSAGAEKEDEEIPCSDFYVGNVEWAPDGAFLVFLGWARDSSLSGIFRVSLSDGKVQPLFQGDRPKAGGAGAFVNLQWLPLARKFMFSKLLEGGAKQIYSMDAEGKQVSLVADGVPTPAWPWYSPDGRQIAYRQGQELRLLSVAGGTSITLATFPKDTRNIDGPAWSHDGRKLAFTDKRQLKVLSEGEDTPKTLLEAPENFEIGGTAWWSGIAWSPDGGQIAYLLRDASKPGARSELWTISSSGGNAHRIATAPATYPVLSDLVWHPVSNMVFVTGQAGAQQKKGYEHWVLENFLPASKTSR